MRGGRDHGTIRSDFPGGFPGDTLNAFTATGRTAGQDSMFQFVRSLLHLRKEHPALTVGTLVQLPPVNEVYAYIRWSGKERILVVVNNAPEPREFKLATLKDQIGSAGALKGLLKGETISVNENSEVEVRGNSADVFEMVR